jgi:hypothetical protein
MVGKNKSSLKFASFANNLRYREDLATPSRMVCGIRASHQKRLHFQREKSAFNRSTRIGNWRLVEAAGSGTNQSKSTCSFLRHVAWAPSRLGQIHADDFVVVARVHAAIGKGGMGPDHLAAGIGLSGSMTCARLISS